MLSIHFLSFVATGARTPKPHNFSITPISTPSIRWLGLLLALGFHAAWLMLLVNAQPEPEPLVLPKPIMVSLISPTEEKSNTSAATPEAVEKPTPVKPKATETKAIEKPKPKTKPKTTPKPAPVKPVLATHSDTASPMSVPTTEIAKPLDKTLPKANTDSPESTNSHSQSGSQTAGAKGNNAPQAPLTLPNLNAGYLHNPAPHYPSESRQNDEEGKVLLRVLVSASGNVEQVTLRKSSGYSRLDDAALSAVKRWRFVPAHRGSEAVSAWVVVPVSFSLDD